MGYQRLRDPVSEAQPSTRYMRMYWWAGPGE